RGGRQSRERNAGALDAVPFTALPALKLAGDNDNNLAVRVHFHALHNLPGSGDGLDRPSQVRLPKCSWRARHGSMWSGQLASNAVTLILVRCLLSAATGDFSSFKFSIPSRPGAARSRPQWA